MIVTIVYAAVPNENISRPGFVPSVTINGKRYGSTYASISYSEAEALSWAKELASWWAAKYIGDWSVTIQEKGNE